MNDILVFPGGTGDAVSCAVQFLKRAGIPFVNHPTPDATHLLLDVPAKEIPVSLLERLPEAITVVGGNLNHPALEGYRKLDLLKDEDYLAQNAAVTAACAVRVAAEHRKAVFSGTPVLVIGWGRIGKCLADLLRRIGCRVTVAARKKGDRSVLSALGFSSADPAKINTLPYEILFNTAPELVLMETLLSQYPEILKIDLASRHGLEGNDVIWARGLPGRYAPESSGKLIADTFLKHCQEETT